MKEGRSALKMGYTNICMVYYHAVGNIFNLNIRFFLQNIGFYKLCTYFIQILTWIWPVRKGQFTFFFQT